MSTTDGLRRSRQQDSSARIARCEKALDRLVARGETITIAAVARAAGVGDKFPFRHPELKAKIDAQAASINGTVRTDIDAALIAERDYWKDRATDFEQRLHRAAQRVAELEGDRVSEQHGLTATDGDRDADLNHLKSNLATAQIRIDELLDEITAVRRLNRDLVRANTRHQTTTPDNDR